MQRPKVRLFVRQPLVPGQPVALSRDQAHYLFTVMRLPEGRSVLLFNGQDGEWRAEVTAAGRRGGTLTCAERTRPLQPPPDLWLMFAPLKKARTDFIVEKATELGAARILPVQSAFTSAERIHQDRLQAHAVEAAEQCGGTYVPEVAALQSLDRVLADWPADRRILWCNEHLSGVRDALPRGGAPGPWAVLVGPEGGFSQAEQARLAALPQVVPAGLGPRILRADTAAVAALTLWQAELGDWR
jgi:16S rRNA (uracil1498-N3)-methyltransferase